MDVFDAIYGRRSVRAFLRDDVRHDLLTKILDSARQAPSAGNLQPWEFVVVRDEKRKQLLVQAALGQEFIAEAPVVVVVFANPQRSAIRYGERGLRLYCLQDTAAAIQNIHLSAYALGLGSCWVGAFDERSASRALDAPPTLRPVAIIPIGYAAERPRPTPRRRLEEITHFEGFAG